MNIEPLEHRIAPALAILNNTTATYTDTDGDKVTLKITIGDLHDAVLQAQMRGLGEQLLFADLRDAGFQGTNLTVSVVKAATGDGLAHIGHIEATGRDLGVVTIAGDLGQIDAGDATGATPAIKALTVRSLGLLGLATQGAAGSLTSNLSGRLGALSIGTDIVGATILVGGGAASPSDSIGPVTIGGSLIGATFDVGGDIGAVKIGRDFLGGDTAGSGQITTSGRITSLTIGGSFVGGPGLDSGRVFGNAGIGPVVIGGDFLGGAGTSSGRITTDASITSVRIGGSMIGGAGSGSALLNAPEVLGPVTIGGNLIGGGNNSAVIVGEKLTSVAIGGSMVGVGPRSARIGAGESIGPVRIGLDLRGGALEDSGQIFSDGTLASLTIGGSIVGGPGSYSVAQPGQVYAGTSIGPVKIGSDIVGGGGDGSGAIMAGTGAVAAVRIGTASVGGSVLGGAGNNSGQISSAGSLGAVTIGGSIAGGTGTGAGVVSANSGALASISVGGSLLGGGAALSENTGLIFSNGDMGAVAIRGDVLGGVGQNSGAIGSLGKLARVSIGGSLVGGAGTTSGVISSTGAMGTIAIGNDFLGGSLPSGTASLNGSGMITSGDRIGSITIGGSIISGIDAGAGSLFNNATIRAVRGIESITVRGDIVGNVTPAGDSPVIVSAGGNVGAVPSTEVAIGKLSVGGRVEWARILGGYDRDLSAANADAQIGTVSVGADWIASSLVSGAFNAGANNVSGGGDDNLVFGDFHDQLIDEIAENPNVTASIASITIVGAVYGTPESVRPTDSFGFVAQKIGAFKVGGRTFTLNPNAGDDGRLVVLRSDGLLDDVTLHEAGANIGATITPGAGAKRVDASTVTYTDSDGDRVTVKISKPLLTPQNVNAVFKFDNGLVDDGAPARQQLQLLNIATLGQQGVGVTFTVVPGTQGDGLAHVGMIDAFFFDLGAVSIPGDLGAIIAGNPNQSAPAISSLIVRSMGRMSADTQLPGGNLVSTIDGNIGALTVRQDLVGAFVDANASIGAVTIGGSLIGADLANSGSIRGTVGAVKIGHQVQGGWGQESGSIGSSVTSLTVGGSILGGAGLHSGGINGAGNFTTATVAHNLLGGVGERSGQLEEPTRSIAIGGSVLGGRGTSSGVITIEDFIGAVKIGHNLVGVADNSGTIISLGNGSITIGGALIGGAGARSGMIHAFDGGVGFPGNIGPVKIGGVVLGGDGEDSGKIQAEGKLGAVTIGGSVLGGSGERTGYIRGDDGIGAISLRHNLLGGSDTNAGILLSDASIASVTIGGSVLGGTGGLSGVITGGSFGPVAIGRDVAGGAMTFSGFITGGDFKGAVTLGGSLIGGGVAGQLASGAIISGGNFSTVKIGHDVLGAAAGNSGWIEADSRIGSVSIGGSLFGGTGAESGGIHSVSGDIGSVSIGRNLTGATIGGMSANLDRSGVIESETGRIARVTVGGSIVAGWDLASGGALTKNATIRAGDDLGAVIVRGSLHGNATASVILSARGQVTQTATDLAIAAVSVGGRVAHAFILGGASTDLDGVNGDAQIGAIKVGGNWLASSAAAGVTAGGDGFGNANDALIAGGGPIVARIAAIQIGGVVAGTAGAGDHFGFVAQYIGSFKSAGYTAPLTPALNVIELSLTTGDVTIREVL